MADVKSLTIHSTKYNIKDETARNNYSTLSQKVNTNEGALNALETMVQSNTTEISNLTEQVDSEITQIKSNVSTLQRSMSSANDTILKLGLNKANASITINSDFLVNQRIASSYTGTASGIYTVDMWKLTNGTLTKPSVGVGVTVTSGSNASTLVQKIPNKYAQSRHTLHTKCAYKEYSTSVQGNNTSTVQIDNSVGSISLTADTDYITVTYTINPNKTAYIEYCDVFMSQDYSAHAIEDYAIARLKCQRYCVMYGNHFNTIGYIKSDKVGRMTLQLPVEMNTTPTVSHNGQVQAQTMNGATCTFVVSNTPYCSGSKSLTLDLTPKEPQTANATPCTFYINSDEDYIQVSCEP